MLRIVIPIFILFLGCNKTVNSLNNDNESNHIIGCTDESACNYIADANEDDGSCTYIQGVCEICEEGVIVNNNSNIDNLCDDYYFNVSISETGESTLFIFKDTITNLSSGDEIGLFDLNGIINSNGDVGEILVGAGIWNGNQLEIIAITSSDLSDFNGPISPGAINGNNVKIKIWDKSNSQLKINILTSIDVGYGTFNGLLTAYSELIIQE